MVAAVSSSEAFQAVPVMGSEAAKWRAVLDRKLQAGAQKFAGVLDTIVKDVPKDEVVKARGVGFTAGERGVEVLVGDSAYVPTDYAIGQMASRAKVPSQYLHELVRSPDGWKQGLAVTILTEHYGNAGEQKLLVRSVNGHLRGWLSDSFRRLNSVPLVEALIEEGGMRLGAVPIDAVVTDTRVALKLVLPEPIEPLPGEYMLRGIEWSNSDFGNGTHSLRAFEIRAVCLNGMTRENVLREIHLGGRLSEDISYSQRTYELDTKASVSALRDVVKGVLGPAGLDATMSRIFAANQREMSAAQLKVATKNQPLATQKAIVDAFESLDVVNLPPGNTAWRGSNAISWIARHCEDAEKRLDLERLAGSLVPAPKPATA